MVNKAAMRATPCLESPQKVAGSALVGKDLASRRGGRDSAAAFCSHSYNHAGDTIGIPASDALMTLTVLSRVVLLPVEASISIGVIHNVVVLVILSPNLIRTGKKIEI